MRAFSTALAIALSLPLAAAGGGCESSNAAGADADTDADTDTDTDTDADTDTGSDTDTGTGSDTDTGSDDGCGDQTKFIYVVERDAKELYRFDPAAMTFELVGALACGGAATPGSMGVNRDGVAYVLFSNEALFAVDIDDASCTPTAYSDAATGFGAFGMGYSSDASSSIEETLYVANATALGALDTAAWTIAEIGPMSSQAEVTGTGDGELWAILPLEARMVRLDKASADELESYDLAGFPEPANIDTFAFAHWGGLLWVFIREFGMGSTTDVYTFDPEGGGFTLAQADIGFVVVGAGVSTCAPVVIE